jgi:hypothetical protein
VRSLFTWLAVCFLLLLSGCAASNELSAGWIAQRGGVVVEDARQQRLDRVLATLVARPSCVKAQVLATDSVCAYGWPNGRLFVTRGMMDRADDGVIAAALAHELGHLISDGHVDVVFSLNGCAESIDAESRADAYGIALLRARHLPPATMRQMLCLVRDTNDLSITCRRGLERRIKQLAESERMK